MKTEKTLSSVGISKTILHKKGIIYFSKQTERRFFFVLAFIMLLLGILAKLGLF